MNIGKGFIEPVRHIEYFTIQTFENQLLTVLAVCLKSYLANVSWQNKPNTKAFY
jgi:hypothetical protein